MDTIPIQSSAGFLFSDAAFDGGGACRPRGRKIDRALEADPDSLASRVRRMFCFDQREVEGLPLVWTGYEEVEARGIGGQEASEERQGCWKV